MNCHLDDYVLREMHATTPVERDYLVKLIHPDNTFNEQESEDITFSKETGTMAVNAVETPRNVFCYVKRSNRTLMRNVQKEQEEGERAHGEAVKITRSIDLVTNIEYLKSATKISEILDCIIRTQEERYEWSEDEQLLIDRALERLRREPDENLDEALMSADNDDSSE